MTEPALNELSTPDIEAPPVGASMLFGDRFDLAQRYAQLLCEQGTEWGLIGPREQSRIWSRHVAHCALVAPALPRDAGLTRLVDVGSGAGLPGLPLAIARPDLHVTLLEPLARRTRFLELAVNELGLGNVEVLQAKADLAPRAQWDLVTSRAVAALETLCAWSLPLLRDGGQLWAIRGSSAAEEILTTAAPVASAGARDVVVQVLTPPPGVELETLTVVHATYSQAHVSRETTRSTSATKAKAKKPPRRR